MITIYSPHHARHDPPHQFVSGELIAYLDTPARALSILEAVTAAGLGPVVEPEPFALEVVTAIHSPELLHHLQFIFRDWQAQVGEMSAVLPAVFPPPGVQLRSGDVVARAGYFAFDLSTPITAGTYQAALAAVGCALSGAQWLLRGEHLAYALCRPPGHHASQDRTGGYCYLNNAATAAHYLAQEGGGSRVALLDFDVHHGNGSQSIFYERSDVLFVSLHGSPGWEYPYFSGFREETGAGAGEGFTVNFPLDKGLEDGPFLEVLDEALMRVADFSPLFLVVSAGFDAYMEDPFGQLKITTAGFRAIGERISSLGIPTLAVQEGGYALEALGDNVVSFLGGLDPAPRDSPGA